MGRPPRVFHPHGIYHLTSHGIDDRPIVRDDIDRQQFCMRFRRLALSEQWEVYAACLMDTHHHLLIGPTLGRVSDGMKLLNGGHSRAFNERHRDVAAPCSNRASVTGRFATNAIFRRRCGTSKTTLLPRGSSSHRRTGPGLRQPKTPPSGCLTPRRPSRCLTPVRVPRLVSDTEARTAPAPRPHWCLTPFRG
jgi:REP element-mobilizing transposase RayT